MTTSVAKSPIEDPIVLEALGVTASCVTFQSRGSIFSTVGVVLLHHKSSSFFKSSSNRGMIVGEAESYRHISAAVPGLCPELIAQGTKEDGEYFLLTRHLDLGVPNGTRTSLAQKLVKLHSCTSPKGFGFPVDNCCGDTLQNNKWNNSWISFFLHQRLEPISKVSINAEDKELKALVSEASKTAVPHLLSSLKIEPALIHGDLWSGNFQQDQIYDSCAIYAHSEYELPLMRMFGGFGGVIEEYHQLKPKDEPIDEYEDRLQLYECYHQLNHSATGQGAGYKLTAKKLLKDLIKRYT